MEIIVRFIDEDNRARTWNIGGISDFAKETWVSFLFDIFFLPDRQERQRNQDQD